MSFRIKPHKLLTVNDRCHPTGQYTFSRLWAADEAILSYTSYVHHVFVSYCWSQFSEICHTVFCRFAILTSMNCYHRNLSKDFTSGYFYTLYPEWKCKDLKLFWLRIRPMQTKQQCVLFINFHNVVFKALGQQPFSRKV